MAESNPPLLPRELEVQLGRLSLLARRPPLAGALGPNASRQRGQGLEFSQYRAYEQGDEPRRIDWKLFARSDRYFVREAESEAALSVCVLLDCSASMAQRDLAAPLRSRWLAGRALAAAALRVAQRQGDRLALLLVGAGRIDKVALAAGPRQRERCEYLLAQAQPAGEWPAASGLHPLWQWLPPASVVLVISDGFEPRCSELLERLARAGRDVRHLALTTVDERDFALRGSYVFEDPETGERRELDGARAAAGFRQAFAEARQTLARRLGAAGVWHRELAIDQPLIEGLRGWLAAAGRG